MSLFGLNNIGDLLGGLTNPFGVASVGQWNLARGIFTNKKTGKDGFVFFYETKIGEKRDNKTALDQISDTGGRRLAVYEYPYKDGQLVRDMGRKGETFVFNIKFFGLNYQNKLKDFLRFVVDSNDPATIIHPIRGSIPVRYKEHELVHRHDEWNAVTVKVTFIEDNTDALSLVNSAQTESPDSAMRHALQLLTDAQSFIGNTIFEVGALLNLPGAIQNAMKARLTSITGQVSGLLGQLAATFSSDAKLKTLAAQANAANSSITNMTSGKVSVGQGKQATLPAVFQVGYDPVTQASINDNVSQFVAASQVTPQQAVFAANQARQAISAAILDINTTMGNLGYDMVVQYREVAVSIQRAVEASIASSKTLVTIYTLPNPMSLRMVAKNNGLDYTRQNDIEALNPYLQSVNYIPAGTIITVPAS